MEGAKLQDSLQEALSHQQFLKDSLMPVLFEKLEREGSETLREADVQRTSLSQRLKVFKTCSINHMSYIRKKKEKILK